MVKYQNHFVKTIIGFVGVMALSFSGCTKPASVPATPLQQITSVETSVRNAEHISYMATYLTHPTGSGITNEYIQEPPSTYASRYFQPSQHYAQVTVTSFGHTTLCMWNNNSHSCLGDAEAGSATDSPFSSTFTLRLLQAASIGLSSKDITNAVFAGQQSTCFAFDVTIADAKSMPNAVLGSQKVCVTSTGVLAEYDQVPGKGIFLSQFSLNVKPQELQTLENTPAN